MIQDDLGSLPTTPLNYTTGITANQTSLVLKGQEKGN